MSDRTNALESWRSAHSEAACLFELWAISHAFQDYIAYRAAADREDAAQDELAQAAA